MSVKEPTWFVIRNRDDQPCEVIPFDGYDQAYQIWESLQENWSECYLVGDKSLIAALTAKVAEMEEAQDKKIAECYIFLDGGELQFGCSTLTYMRNIYEPEIDAVKEIYDQDTIV